MSHGNNIIAQEYRNRISWIQGRIIDMASQTDGNLLKSDVEAMIYNRYDCSPDSVRRYLKTLEGKRIIESNDTHIIVPSARKPKE